MRAVILSVTLGASLATANIIFNHIPLSCDASVAGYTGCLRGQHCSQDGTCETSDADLYPLSFRSVDVGRRDLSVDGRCGPMNGGLQCDPNATGYQGTCCSQYGWCGNTSAYCGTGCTAGCDGAAPTQPGGGGTDPRSDGRCGAAFGGATCDPSSAVGGCCSAAGFCGNDDAHCLVSNGCQSGCSNGTAPRPDGQCGSAFGNAVCDPTTAVGGCCSAAGFCGNDDAHCLVSNGCQSGCSKVTSPSASPTPSGGSGASPRPDGRCGAAFGGATCDPTSAVGGCCSAAGWCGNTDAHCLVTNGCQSGCAGGGSGGTPPSGPAGPGTVVQSKPPSSTTTGEPVLGQASPTAAPTGGGFTADGTCGQSNGGTECGNWPQGACCSMYGFCGNTTAHCGDGCQSGPCSGGAVVPAPGPSPAPGNQNGGSFKTVGQSGVPAMHAALLPNGRLTFLDKVENYTQLKLSDGQYAYSSEYDPIANSAVGLAYKTNSFCAGGALLADGRVVALGGNAPLPDIDPTVGDGFTGIRYLARSSTDASLDGQSWSEPGNKLASARWYPTAQVLGDGSVFVASGSLNGLDPRVLANNNPTWELLNAEAVSSGVNVPMDILAKNQPYYMYPFIHLLQDGTLFVFVSKSSEIFNVGTNTTVKPLPDLPGDYRTYPNTGGSVMLPLSSATQWNPDIVICGGGAYQDITSPTDPSCGRIQPLSNNPQWELDSMPEGRCMVEGTLLPDGTVIWLNGADRGAQGFGLATDPAYEVLIYDPTKPLGQRFTTGPSSTIARLYHSVATLLLDGTLLVTGSNPVEQPILTPDAANPYVTEFRVEIYTPPYLSGDNANRRPGNVVLSSTTLHADSSQFTITFSNPTGAQGVQIVLYQGGFVTHSLHMGHRMAYLDNTGFSTTSTTQTVTATMPPNTNIAPPGPYVIYVVVDGVPAIGQFVQVSA